MAQYAHMLLCLLFSAAVVCAQFPPMVFRVDMHPPEHVNFKGFPALGDNDDLHDHVTGASCQSDQDNTEFVDTTASFEVAESWVKALSDQNPGVEVFYIYWIKTNDQFYSCPISLEKVSMDHRDTDTRVKYSNDVILINRQPDRKRWLANEGIPASLILGAMKYTIIEDYQTDTKTLQWHSFQRNKRARKVENSTVNKNAYEMREDSATHHSFREQLPLYPNIPITACFPVHGTSRISVGLLEIHYLQQFQKKPRIRMVKSRRF